MNTHAVYESVCTLRADSVAYRPTPPVFGRKDKNQPLALHTRWAEATNDPHWAWRIAVNYHQSLEPLPASLSDQNVRQAYRYLEGARDDQLAMAHSIRTSLDAGMTGSVLQGFLCARDISLEGIASLLGLELDVVKLYEGLFFGVRNREGSASSFKSSPPIDWKHAPAVMAGCPVIPEIKKQVTHMIARFGSWVLTVLLLTVHAGAATTITKVDPPNWWVPHTLNPIQVLLMGDDLKGATVTTMSTGFKIETRYASDNGHYLFAYVDIGKQVQPGTYHFQVRNASGTGEFELRLDRPLEARGRFQGFGPDDVIYLLMPDRFANGDPSNDPPPQANVTTNQDAGGGGGGGGGRRGGGRGGPGYHGGDLRGVRDHLDYLKDLGVTGVWMTPIYRNSASNSGGTYHGYSTVDYYDVEPRFGTMKEFKELVDAAHRLGMKVVQDQVANHCGPRHPWNADPPTKTWFNNTDTTPKPRNNYDIASLSDPYARPSRRAVPVRGWFAGSLPDLNQDDPLVSDYEIQNAVWWIGMTGIDGVRQDTYPYVDRSFWEKWQTAINREYPDFVCVSEITADTPAVLSFFEGGIRRYGIDTKLRAELDFPLEHTTQRVFGNSGPMTDLVNILAQDSLYLRPEMLVTFVGNHDQPRMLTVARGDISKLLMAQTFTLTTRRTVHMYYGDEIALGAGPGTGDAAARANFPGGFPGDEVNAFKPEGRTGDTATVFNWTRGLLHFRQDHPALRRGDMVNLLVARDQYAYLRSSLEEHVLVLLNRAGNANSVELAVDDIALPDGLYFKSFPGRSADLVVTAGKLVINEPKEIEIYWAERTRSRK